MTMWMSLSNSLLEHLLKSQALNAHVISWTWTFTNLTNLRFYDGGVSDSITVMFYPRERYVILDKNADILWILENDINFARWNKITIIFQMKNERKTEKPCEGST